MIRLHQLWPLARQYPFRGSCTILSAVLAVGSALLWYHVQSLAVLQQKRQAEGEAALVLLISGPQLRQELAFAQQTTKRIADNLISEEDLADNVNYFYKMEEESKAHLDLRPFNAPPADTSLYKRIPFALKVSGSFSQVTAFVQAVETGPRLSSINYFSLRKRAGGAAVIELNLDLLGKK